MSCATGAHDNSEGWRLILSKTRNAAGRGGSNSRKRDLRSCLWLRDHDPCTVDGLLEAALVGDDKKTRLAAAGTLLAVTDALEKALWPIEKGGLSPARGATTRPGPPSSQSKASSTGVQVEAATAAAGAGDRTPSPTAAVAKTTTGTAAAAARPTALACFAAECALALTSACALVASAVASSTGPATPEAAGATGPAATPVPLSAATTAAGGGHTDEGSCGEKGAEVAPVVEADDIYRDSGRGETSPARQAALARSRGGPVRATDGEEEAGKKGAGEEEREQTRAAIAKERGAAEEPQGRWRALRVLSELLPSSTIPLLVLAEAWLGGVAEEGASVGAVGSGSGRGNGGSNDRDLYNRQPGSDGRGPGGVRATSRGENAYSGVSVSWDSRSGWSEAGRSARLPFGDVRGAVAGEGGRGLAATAVRDLVAVLVSVVNVARRLEEREAEKRRVLERDGLEESEISSPRHGRDVVLGGMVKHAAWHLARTMPSILSSRRWPTAQLKGGGGGGSAAGGRRGGGGVRSELLELVGELRACDPRVLEMAGIEPPEGVEEGRWLTLRNLCICVGGARTKDVFRAGVVGGRADGDDGGGDGEGGGDLVGALQEALIRSFCGSKPEAQKLASSALVWVMSAALEENKDKSGSLGPTKDRLDVGPLLGLLGQAGEGGGDSGASDAVCLVLTGLAVNYPLLVVPKVLRAATGDPGPAADTPPGDASGASPGWSAAARLRLTVILADALRCTDGGRLGHVRFSARDEDGGISPFDGVGEHLIQCLGSDDLRLRNVASEGLVSLDPGWVVPRLCRRLSEREAGEEGTTGRRQDGGGDGVYDGIGGSGWESRGRSAALQALGNLIVHGIDPPDALSALLDSLRNDPPPEPIGNLAEGGGGGGGSDSGVVGSDDRKSKGLVGRVMGSLPLWARRLKKRSDAVHEPEEALVVSRQAGRSPAGGPTGVVVAAEEEDEEDEEADATLTTAWVVASPTLYGECLEVAAIKALAAPGEPLPVRFFAALAAASSASGGGVDNATGADDKVDGRTSAAAASVVPTDVAEDISTVTLSPTDTPASTETSAAGTPVTCTGEEHQSGLLSAESVATGARTAVGGEARAGRRRKRSGGCSKRRRRSTLAGVLQLVRGRMTGQARLSEDLLGDESQEASETVRALLFCRLTPLLILNALPPAALLSEDQQEQAMSMEFSKEDLHGCGVGSRRHGSPVAGGSEPTKGGPPPCGLGACLEEIRALLLERTEQLYEYDQRALFTACHAATSHGASVGPWLAPLLSAIVRVALLPVTSDADDDVAQVQKAAMNCLAVLLQSSAQATAATSAKIDLASKAFEWEITSSVVPETGMISSDAVPYAIFSPMEIGDVPELAGSVAVGGVLPERFRGGDEGSWLDKSLKEAFRREGRQENGEKVGAEGGSDEGGSGSGGGRVPALPAQLRMCFANSAVTVARRCPPESLPALCSRGNLLGTFLTGASRGSGLLRAACLQALFALVYRTKNVFEGGAISGSGSRVDVSCTCDGVMQVACDALGKDQHPEVRVSGLKLLLGVVAAGASPSAAAAKTSPVPSRDPHEQPPTFISDAGGIGNDRGITEIGGGGGPGRGVDDGVGDVGRVRGDGGDGGVGAGVNRATSGGIPSGTEIAISLSGSRERGTAGIREAKTLMMPDRHCDKSDTLATAAGAGASTGGSVLSPAVMSRAKRLLIGLSNIDESAEVRKLASQALAALGGSSTS
ncbi:expressed unknown protein [Ectocarpus siliculosus]|uniref:Uncharacterized protein n=1 Tax=Ectocarpus siliculosus TaxID=2880 RepID=D7G4H8_ECTSI|nr:expressed unknown protein [Ectocarpus siliculosus]|eukprot:CBJ48881.1 expressed unknown protein [Ectocarpus siliculosus]